MVKFWTLPQKQLKTIEMWKLRKQISEFAHQLRSMWLPPIVLHTTKRYSSSLITRLSVSDVTDRYLRTHIASHIPTVKTLKALCLAIVIIIPFIRHQSYWSYEHSDFLKVELDFYTYPFVKFNCIKSHWLTNDTTIYLKIMKLSNCIYTDQDHPDNINLIEIK